MEGSITDVMFAASCLYLEAFVYLAKDFDDLIYGVSFFLHDSGWLLARQNLIFNGPVCGGQVNSFGPSWT
jgi:hypothetical protein